MESTKFIIERKDGRFYGSMVWTYDEKRAVHFPTKELAEAKAKAYPSAIVRKIELNQ